MAKQNNTPRLLRVADDPKVRELEADLAKYEAQLPALRERHNLAVRALEQAQAAHDLTERAVLAGRKTDADLAAAQAALLDAKREEAVSGHNLAEVQHLCEVLPEAIALAKQAARAVVAANLRADFTEAARRLKAALLEAQAASDEANRIRDHAASELTVNPYLDDHPSHGLDAGEAGLILHGAGLPLLTLEPFFARDHQRNSQPMVDIPLKEIDMFLAQVPTMAEADKQRKAAHQSREAQRKAENREKLARLAEMERRNLERYGAR